MKKLPQKLSLRALFTGALCLFLTLSLFGCTVENEPPDPIGTFDPGGPVVDLTEGEEDHEDGYEDDGQQIIDISALEDMNETYPVKRYAVTFENIDAEPLVYYVFGLLDDVTYYTDVYDGEVAPEVTVIWTSDSDQTKYMSCMEYGELYFERGDTYEDEAITRTPEQVDEMVREVLSMHGVPTDNLVMGGRAAEDGAYYYDVLPIDNIRVPYTSLGIYVIADEDITALSYRNITDEIMPTGDTFYSISAWEAANKIYELTEEELRFYDDLIFESAQLEYEVVKVEDHADKGILTPVWSLYTEDGSYLQVDAITGDIRDGIDTPSFTIDQYNGTW